MSDISIRRGVLRTRYFSFRVVTRTWIVCAALAAAASLVCVISVSIGDDPIPIGRVVRAIFGYGDSGDVFIVQTLRLPRALTALLVGAALGTSGAIFQSISRNPLGSPDIIGFTTGAATGALLEILIFHGGTRDIALASIIGGIITALAVYLLAFKRGVQGYRLVLIGIGISAMLTSVNSYLLTRANINDAASAQVWLTGSLNGRGWEHVRPISIALVILLPAAFALGRSMRLLEMGDDSAKALGVPVERSRLTLVLVAVALTGVGVASAGPVSFVALAAPQLARRLTRSAGSGLIAPALMGAFLLSASDFAAQHAMSTQLPVGVATGTIGGIYLGWLLAREWRTGHG